MTARVVVFVNGGGVCWDARTCAFTGERGESGYYDGTVGGVEPSDREGMADISHDDSPFTDCSRLYVSSCTGDAHRGDRAQEYGRG